MHIKIHLPWNTHLTLSSYGKLAKSALCKVEFSRKKGNVFTSRIVMSFMFGTVETLKNTAISLSGHREEHTVVRRVQVEVSSGPLIIFTTPFHNTHSSGARSSVCEPHWTARFLVKVSTRKIPGKELLGRPKGHQLNQSTGKCQTNSWFWTSIML